MSVPFLSSVLRRFRTYEPVDTIELSNNGETLTIDKMRQTDDGIYDKIKQKHYSVTDDPVKLIVKRPIKPGVYQVHLLDTLSAVTVKIRRGESVFWANCNAGLAGRALDSMFMKQTFGEQFGLRQKLVYILVCGAFGYLIGLAF
jgi:hypothetical protein